MKRKAIIYTRFSPRPGAADSQSAQAQEDSCREYCSKHNITVLAAFADKGKSGTDPDRTGLWDAIDVLKVNYVLVAWRYDRLARSLYLHETIRRSVERVGAKIEVVEGSTNGSSAEDVLIRQVLAAFAEYEKKVMALRTKHAMLRYQERGKIMSKRLPYGFRHDTSNPGHMIEDSLEQETIEVMIQLWTEYEDERPSLRAIANELDLLGYPPRDATFWSHKTVASTLRRKGILT